MLTLWKNRLIRLIVVLGVASTLFAVLARLAAVPLDETLSRAFRAGLLFVVLFSILADIVQAKRVSMNTVLGAACVYLMLSLAWSQMYAVVELLHPGSFNISASVGEDFFDSEGELLYYSLITLSTVGYGDITPVTPQARMLSALEGVAGQLFMAIILARLVAMELAGRQSRSE
jgi:hypothetical protein